MDTESRQMRTNGFFFEAFQANTKVVHIPAFLPGCGAP